MKIAIHDNNSTFSNAWISYCKVNKLEFKIVDCYSSSIAENIKDCDIVMWHHQQNDYRDLLFAKQLLFSIEQSGKKVYPDFKSGWHFDDKVGQKYLLELVDAPLVPSFVFYDKNKALAWAKKIHYPVVFKLRGGAGAANVRLIKSYNENKRIISKSFGSGHSSFNPFTRIKDTFNLYKSGRATNSDLIKAIGRLFFPNNAVKLIHKERGYVYYQEFLPENDCDIRLIVIGRKRAYGMKRMVREGDFRASGSKNFIYNEIDSEVVKLAFEVAEKLELQTVAFDFIYDQEKKVRIVEMSYGFGTSGSGNCKGYWDRNLKWNEGSFSPLDWIIEDLIDL
ncbi:MULTISPECIES: ATP-grasp domain-containing protein [unclassified Myroides]|uniref:ATP-grasp domain-containing protein n=1 Tax=unclassified Myroides TaxID=2642485 RepID=UPI00310117A9